jgi:hypothetical protein
MPRKTYVALASAVAARIAIERLQNFRAPPPPPATDPNIGGSDRGDPRGNVNRDVASGGDLDAASAKRNVQS